MVTWQFFKSDYRRWWSLSVKRNIRRFNYKNHVVTSVANAVSNCNIHKCSIARRQERSIRYFAMSIAKRLIWFTSLTLTSAGRNTQEKVSNHSTKEWMDRGQHLQRLSPHGLDWPTVDEGPDTAALTSVSLMLRRSASVNHVVTSVASAVSNCNTHKCPIAKRQVTWPSVIVT
jgi:hypothetical protein